ncbi:MAG: class E sortase [Thermoleophilaceae bacterium]|nr:class E sortase [Thermoleophilaceae bacterium]
MLLSAGALALADAALTVAWKEPVTALLQGMRQNDLENRLERLSIPAPPAIRDPRERLAAQARSLGAGRKEGQPVGRLELARLGVEEVVVQGTSTVSLRKGPAHYGRTGMPGSGRTVAIAGHRTTHGAPFAEIDDLERGDRISLHMPYGRFDYAVEGSRIVSPRETGVLRGVGRERLVLTACHPKWSADKRIVVFARLAGVDTRSSTRRSS